MSSSLSEILFKDYRRRVLALLLMHPDKHYHVREIARLTNTVAGTLHKELSRLEQAGILKKEQIGNLVQYSADKHCPIFEELSNILKKTTGAVEVLAEALSPLAADIDIALVFGSVASDKMTSASDVDLLVIGKVKFADVVKAVYPCQEVLQREINPKIFTHRKWQQLILNKDSFAKDIVRKPKLFILGTENELRQANRENTGSHRA